MHDTAAIEENLRATLAMFARAKSTGETRAWPGVAVCCSAVEFSMFNATVLTSAVQSVAELDERIGIATAYYASRQLPWSFWVCEGWLGRSVRGKVGDAFYHHRLHLVVDLPGMTANFIAPPTRTLPALEYRRVGDAQTRSAFSHIMSMSFGIPSAISRQIYEAEGTWRGGFTGWIGYLDGAAVTTTATLVAGGVIGVYAVGTLPSRQRSGYGEAVMRHALEQARAESGLERSVLESSDAGFRLYERMGYRTITRYAVFAGS